MVGKEMLEVLATQGTPQAVFSVWAGVRKVATFSHASSYRENARRV